MSSFPGQRSTPMLPSRTSATMALALLCIALVGAFLLDRQARVQASAQLRSELLRVASHRAGELAQGASRLRSDTLLLASMPPVQGLGRTLAAGGADPVDGSSLSDWRQRLEQIFVAYLQSNPHALRARLIGIADGGRELVRVDRSGDAAAPIASADLGQEGARSFVLRGLGLPAGSVLVDGPPALHGREDADGDPVRTLRLVTPLRDEEGSTFGVLVIDVDADGWLRRFLAHLPEGFLPYLVDPAGRYALTPPSAGLPGLGGERVERWQDEFDQIASGRREDGETRVEDWQHVAYGQPLMVATSLLRLAPQIGDGEAMRLHMVASPDLMARQVQRSRQDALLIAGLLAVVALAGALLFRRGEQRLLALRLEQSRLAAIVEGSQDAIIGKTLAGEVTSWNRGAERLLGWSAAEMIGRSIFDVVPEERRQDERDNLASIASGNVVRQLRTERLHKDGRTISISATLSPVRDGEGRVVGASVIARDITGEHVAAERLADDHARLEGEVELRTAALQRALGRAEQADRAKSQFVANMSHEIRTPLNAVLGMLALIERGGAAAQMRDYARKASMAARSLLRLLDDVLDFSRIEADRLEIESAPFSPESLFRDLAVLVGEQRRSSQVELMFDLDPRIPPTLRGDRLRLQQVLANLAGNALKFTEVGSVVLKARCVGQDERAVRISFEMRDSGIGMSPDQLARVFRPFVQADASTSRRFGGSGLGLVISRRLIEAMGGQLEGSSEVGVGSCFSFTLAFGLAGEMAGGDARPPLEGQRALVVDDSALCREVIGSMLEAMGCRCDLAGSGFSALETVSAAAPADPFDVLLLDYRLPDMDGLDLARRIVELDLKPTPRILLVTAHGDEFAEALRVEPGQSWPWLAKPVTPGQLIQAVLGEDSPTDAAIRGRRLEGLRLLLAEDNPLNREVALELMQAEGAEVTCVGDGEAAVAAITSEGVRFDAVLMDLQMPRLDGLAATRALRKAGHVSLPVVALTANAYARDRDLCLAAGMDAHLGKPFDIDQLVAVMLRVLGRPLRSPQPAASPVTPTADGPWEAPLVEAAELQLRRFAGNRQALQRALQRFPAEAKRLMADLQEACRHGDTSEAATVAHALKGVAATVGAPRLARQSAHLEDLARDPDVRSEQLLPQLGALEQLVQASRAALETRLTQPDVQESPVPRTAGDAPGNELEALAGLIRGLEQGEMDSLAGLRGLADAHPGDADWAAVGTAAELLDLTALRRAASRLGARTGGNAEPDQ
ncbi:response regulator [Pseudomarimonas salicorniae]|uniref:histidine kinase n=1 Tax=Pseudomarimonas salicorniae TaxID=2933270 RepID=A0ABT0GLY8_9GAMM|nr:response regulator [Lysobacter sp. CAU 1642]MCK7595047.1 response regulator [Lysobacter sp. CAU 1642]